MTPSMENPTVKLASVGRGLLLPCPCCGEASATIVLELADMETFTCRECDTEFAAATVQAFLAQSAGPGVDRHRTKLAGGLAGRHALVELLDQGGRFPACLSPFPRHDFHFVHLSLRLALDVLDSVRGRRPCRCRPTRCWARIAMRRRKQREGLPESSVVILLSRGLTRLSLLSSTSALFE